MAHREIALDTETTGLSPKEGHRIIEIGCVEMIDRRITGQTYHCYIQPERDVPMQAQAVHGITDEFLADMPLFQQIADDFLAFIGNDPLVIHNASFDCGFLDHELAAVDAGHRPLKRRQTVIDTLSIARKKHPRQANNLDALCRRYGVNNQNRSLHGALLDADLLAKVYLEMTRAQHVLQMPDRDVEQQHSCPVAGQTEQVIPVRVVQPTTAEQAAHRQLLDALGIEYD